MKLLILIIFNVVVMISGQINTMDIKTNNDICNAMLLVIKTLTDELKNTVKGIPDFVQSGLFYYNTFRNSSIVDIKNISLAMNKTANESICSVRYNTNTFAINVTMNLNITNSRYNYESCPAICLGPTKVNETLAWVQVSVSIIYNVMNPNTTINMTTISMSSDKAEVKTIYNQAFPILATNETKAIANNMPKCQPGEHPHA